MRIDWFTVGAQVLNFLVLVWLLKRYLYKPILHAIDAREKRIAATVAEAAAQKTEALKERDAFRQKNETFDRQRDELLGKATEEATAERQRLLDEARQAADSMRAKRRESFGREARNLNQAIALQTQREVFAIARKALADLASTRLEAHLGEVFVRRLRALDGEAKAALAGALRTASGPALVRSAFELPAEQRAAIQKALDDAFPAEPPPSSPGARVRFETAPDLIGGVELSANGQKVAWSIADYLASLEASVGELLEGKPLNS